MQPEKRVVVFAFDRDSTVSTGGGPVPIEVVRELAKKHIAYAIGNRALCSEAGIPYAEGRTKEERLRWIRDRHPGADEYIVVDDVPIRVEGWKYYSPSEFARVLNRGL